MTAGSRVTWLSLAFTSAVVGVGALVLLSVPAAGASVLKPPFEHYTLTYEASDTAQGSQESTALTPPAGFSMCEVLPDTTVHANSSVRVLMSYALTFGRYHARGERAHLALLYKVATHSITGSTEATAVENPRAGCPPLSPALYTLENANCRQQVGSEQPSVDFDSNGASTQFDAELSLGIELVGHPSCTGNTDPGTGGTEPNPTVAPDFGTPNDEGPLPASAEIAFSASGIEHRHTFHGRVEIVPADVPAEGQGVEPTFDGASQRTWSFSSSPAATFTLAPTRAGH
jgi:hypothetical protein